MIQEQDISRQEKEIICEKLIISILVLNQLVDKT